MPTRILSLDFDGKHVQLTPEYLPDGVSSCMTVLVGKNGIGKSRLLAELVKVGLNRLTKVVAVSTSPFDKFPTQRKRSGLFYSNYRYVGMRTEGIYQSSSSVSLMSSAVKGLLEKLAYADAAHNLTPVFNALNFHPVADFVLKPGYLKSGRVDYDISRVEGSSLAIELRRLDREHDIQIDERYFDLLENLDFPRRLDVLESIVRISKVLTRRRAVELRANFAASTISLEGLNADSSLIHSILVLMDVGLIRLMDLVLDKKEFGQLSVKRASSGEQCLLVMILGIAGHIDDGSLVLIDEPEISLHPRWQEEFMTMLTSSFASYNDCQFIIATHSPQIIARLKGAGSYVVSLSRGEIYAAEDFFDKSADFQLAELFDAPGMMNEYIARVAFNLLAKVKHSKKVDVSSRRDLEHLRRLDQQLDETDPIKELIKSVSMLCDSYAEN